MFVRTDARYDLAPNPLGFRKARRVGACNGRSGLESPPGMIEVPFFLLELYCTSRLLAAWPVVDWGECDGSAVPNKGPEA